MSEEAQQVAEVAGSITPKGEAEEQPKPKPQRVPVRSQCPLIEILMGVPWIWFYIKDGGPYCMRSDQIVGVAQQDAINQNGCGIQIVGGMVHCEHSAEHMVSAMRKASALMSERMERAHAEEPDSPAD